VFTEDGDHSKVLRSNASRIITRILQLGQSSSDTTSPTKEFDVKALVHMADAFSVRYCLEAMRYLKTKATWNPDDEKVLEDAILESFTNRSDVWAQLLGFAEESTNRAIHAWAQDQLLSLAASRNGMEDAGAHEHMRRCLELLAVTSRAANRGEDIAAVGTITEKLKEIEGKLSELSDEDAESSGEFSGLLDQMQIMLHLSVMHIHTVPDESEASKHARAMLFGALCSLLVYPSLQLHQEITELLFDLSSTLSDNLADATECAIKLPPSLKLPQDPRLDFIMDNESNAADTWLALAYQERPAGSQQQRSLGKQPLQLGGRAPPSSSQQQSPQHQRWPSASGHPSFMRQDSRLQPPPEFKTTQYQLRRWEIFSDPTPVMGENDGSLSLGLFGARKV
jgi:mediator of RNA polymerase II transcription subunit 12